MGSKFRELVGGLEGGFWDFVLGLAVGGLGLWVGALRFVMGDLGLLAAVGLVFGERRSLPIVGDVGGEPPCSVSVAMS